MNYRDATNENEEETYKTPNRLLEKPYHESNHASALGSVEKLYRTAKKHGITRSQVIAWLQLQSCSSTISSQQSFCERIR